MLNARSVFISTPMNTDAKPENTPGIFLEHFDVAPGQVTHEQILKTARQVAMERGWGFRSYSSGEWWATNEDFVSRRIVSFPTLVLFLDGEEAGRITMSEMAPSFISRWVDKTVANKIRMDREVEA